MTTIERTAKPGLTLPAGHLKSIVWKNNSYAIRREEITINKKMESVYICMPKGCRNILLIVS